ncbi:Hsp20/alpha crystallin family protein [Lederbergia citrea]|uniref:Hsp20/alpha crystallin family protein n=1 Tax=Lederbergia citrea TaxID=2833581 RepID=A0A942UJX0_9BACI|nr:Hsp20/alpha crystallin family protein [Lederbergia citrea]MBS4222050.1 Hsp20/alpha crystallin family protein [Lederbergia citrea]
MIPWGMFPFNDQIKKMTEQMNNGDVHSYVQEMMKKLVPSPMETTQNPFNTERTQSQPSSQTDFQVNVFETFDDVFVRISLPADVSLENMKIFHTSNQAIVENMQEKGSRKVITLPCLVKKKGATAQVKDGILEIKIPKSDDLQFTEISISEKY